MTSPLFLVLLALLALAAAYGASAAYVQRRRARALAAWLRRRHPDAYRAVPEQVRERPAMVLVRHVRWQGLVDDREFDARYRSIERVTRHITAGLLLALVVIGVMVATGGGLRRAGSPGG